MIHAVPVKVRTFRRL